MGCNFPCARSPVCHGDGSFNLVSWNGWFPATLDGLHWLGIQTTTFILFFNGTPEIVVVLLLSLQNKTNGYPQVTPA